MSTAPSKPMILLLHDSELQEVRGLLNELEVPFIERSGNPTEVDQRTRWDLIIASQKRIHALESRSVMTDTVRIAMVDTDSRTLRAMMKRLGVDFVVARPVHSAALRLLVVHALYRGPEKRRQLRVSVGAPIQYRSGLVKRSAFLADLSLRGCRMLTRHPIKPGKKISVHFSAELDGKKGFAIPGKVLRCDEGDSPDAEHSLAVSLKGLAPAQGQRLRRVFENYKNGPARLANRASGSTAILEARAARIDAESSSERRTTDRYEFSEQVLALSEEATRVLICRDISLGGMRVEPNDTLVPGDSLKLAVHACDRSEPMVVDATVARDDGSKGLVLTFHDLTDNVEEQLRKLIGSLPIVTGKQQTDEAAEQGLVVSRIVERHAS